MGAAWLPKKSAPARTIGGLLKTRVGSVVPGMPQGHGSQPPSAYCGALIADAVLALPGLLKAGRRSAPATSVVEAPTVERSGTV